MSNTSRIPVLGRGVRLRHDKVRDSWVLLAPERIFKLDAIGHAILEQVDGQRNEAAIVATLAALYKADNARVGADVASFLDSLQQRRVLEFL